MSNTPPSAKLGARPVAGSIAVPFVLALAVLSASGALAQPPALVVLNKAENSLAVMDPASAKVVLRVPTGEGPHEVALSPDGRTAFVTNYGAQAPGSSLSVIDLATGKEVRRVELGPLRRPHGIVVRGSGVYFTAEANRVLARYDAASNTIDWIMGTGEGGTHMVVASRDGETLFTSNLGADSVSAMRRAQGGGGQGFVVTRIPVGKAPEGIDISPDGRELWTAHSQDGGVSVIDVASLKVVATFDLGTKRSNRLQFTPDGRLVLVSDLTAGDLVVIDAAGRRVAKRIPLGKAPSGILVVPDGSRAYVALTGENALAIVDLQRLEPTGRIATGEGPDGMAWRQ
jgi:YVTN family beta-propeller protein